MLTKYCSGDRMSIHPESSAGAGPFPVMSCRRRSRTSRRPSPRRWRGVAVMYRSHTFPSPNSSPLSVGALEAAMFHGAWVPLQ